MSMERPCVLVGVTGCIAAYKACEIVRGLQKAGVRVKVVMTEHGTHFVDPGASPPSMWPWAVWPYLRTHPPHFAGPGCGSFPHRSLHGQRDGEGGLRHCR